VTPCILKVFCRFYSYLHFSMLSHVSIFVRVSVCTYTNFRTFICTYISFRISIFTYTRLPVFILAYIGVKTFNIYLQIFLSVYLFCCVYTLPGFLYPCQCFQIFERISTIMCIDECALKFFVIRYVGIFNGECCQIREQVKLRAPLRCC